jgi:hypothetical protein
MRKSFVRNGLNGAEATETCTRGTGCLRLHTRQPPTLKNVPARPRRLRAVSPGNTDLTLWQQLGIIAILLLTSKGAAGITGSGFIVLAATFASVGSMPVASIALILGIDRLMSEARIDQPDRQRSCHCHCRQGEGSARWGRLHRRLDRRRTSKPTSRNP